jgi:glycosyltransferase involved in cell wall biosynthesis
MKRDVKSSGRDLVAYHVHDPNIPFVRTDIQYFALYHQRVLIFTSREVGYSLPANVEVVSTDLDWSRHRPVRITLRWLHRFIGIYIQECWKVRKLLPFTGVLRKLVANVFRAMEITRLLRERDATDAWHYAFWFYDCIYLAWLRERGEIPLAVARAHSGDLYEDHVSIRNSILLRHYQLDWLDGVFPISAMGSEYLALRYTESRASIKTYYLGTTDPGCFNPHPVNEFVIVSCATFRHHKRIHRIAEALLHVRCPVTWVHFGDERLGQKDPAMAEYMRIREQLLQSPHVRFVPMGYRANADVMEYYKAHSVSLFVSLSRYEGIPVSMMEAISFGIPVLSTDVGGCREIVNERTGMLIPLDTPVEEVARIIEGFSNSHFSRPGFRNGVREEWASKFDAGWNYVKFFEEVAAF